MSRNVYQMHSQRKPFFASGHIGAAFSWADKMCVDRKRTFLREWRQAKGKTLVAVAENLHMSHSQLSRVETGKQPYNEDLLEALADLYGCDVVDLLIRDPSDPEGMWSLWDRAKPGERRRIVAVADALLKDSA